MSSKERLYLGRAAEDGEPTFIRKHSWDCGWYWGFGYIGNGGCQYHIDSWLHKYKVGEVLRRTKLTQEDWETIRSAYALAYTLKKAANALHKDPLGAALNKKLEYILNDVWNYMKERLQ